MRATAAGAVGAALLALLAAGLVHGLSSNREAGITNGGGGNAPVIKDGRIDRLVSSNIPGPKALPEDLVRYARNLLGTRLGGVWMSQLAGDGYRVGVVSPTAGDQAKLSRAFASLGVPGEVVSVANGEAKLQAVLAALESRLSGVNATSEVPISVGIRPDLDAVKIVAPLTSQSSNAQRQFVYRAATDFESAVRVNSRGAIRGVTLPCRSVFCDPPLRGGIWIYGKLAGCTGAFIVRSVSDGRLYQLTAGHCQYLWNGTWLTDFVNGSTHRIGPIHFRRFDFLADVGIVTVLNVPGWRPRAWVAVRPGAGQTRNDAYSIRGASIPVVGQRVCVSGAGLAATNCGYVTRTGVAVTYRDQGVTVGGLVEASVCTRPGDSGSPVFAGHIAYGVVSGQLSSCDSLFVPIRTAEASMRVRVARDAG